jgi:3-hydroxyacyl-[acyl-carrier-protein] dehydratase
VTESRWTTLDRVTRLEPGEGADGLRNVPNTLAIFDSHFPRFHVLPGVLILGSLGELAARLLEEETGTKWRLKKAEKIAYRHWAQPGDQMELSVKVKERGDDEAVLSGDVRVDGGVITRARILRMVPVA